MAFTTERQRIFNDAVRHRYEECFLRHCCDTLVAMKTDGTLKTEDQHKRFKMFLNFYGDYAGIVAGVAALNAAPQGTPLNDWAEETVLNIAKSVYEHCLGELDKFEDAEPDLLADYIVSRLETVSPAQRDRIALELEAIKWSCHVIADMQHPDDHKIREPGQKHKHPAYSHLHATLVL